MMIKRPLRIMHYQDGSVIVDDDLSEIAIIKDYGMSERLIEIINEEPRVDADDELAKEFSDANIIKTLQKKNKELIKQRADLRKENKDLKYQINNYLDEED